jgi:type II secretory ATPase GspE/PulE/Tfp pilus assembly ATPase PilB-like protein
LETLHGLEEPGGVTDNARRHRENRHGRHDIAGSPLTADTILTRGRGCSKCRGTGYRGRIGIFELLVLSREFKEAVVGGARGNRLQELATEGGMRSLRSHGLGAVAAGLTTVEEVLRVTAD